MSEWLWIFWTVLGAILIVAEIFTSGFVLLWFGVGAMAAALLAIVGIDSLALQFLTFAVVSSTLTAASRTIFLKYFSREKTGQSLRSGVDSLPGKIGDGRFVESWRFARGSGESFWLDMDRVSSAGRTSVGSR
jgi:membrane protein implicated in regulation of membrane protease activity